MSAYPVLYEADYVEQRSRLTVFFRALLVIPHAFVACFIGIAAFFTVVAAWFALVVTGRYPQGLYDFNAGALRWLGRFTAYAYLQTDRFPPFGFGDDPGYPVRMRFAGPLPAYSRLKAGLRLLLLIPIWIALYVVGIILSFIVIAAWLVIVITGKQPSGLHDVLDTGIAYTMKAYAYAFLLTETYPPISNSDPVLEPVGGSGELPPAAPPAFTPPAS